MLRVRHFGPSDTNFFLHYVHSSQASWADLGIAGEVRLVVVSAIQAEMDRKKHELRGRALAMAFMVFLI